MTNACPALEQLERLLQEQLAEAERRAVEQHVEQCASCQQQLDRLLDADREHLLPTEGLNANAESVAAGDEVLERLKQSPPCDGDTAERVSQVVFRFPGPPTPRGPLGQLRSYHMIELLGTGATGCVFKGYDEQLHRLVAIKVLRPELAVLAGSRLRFLREARAAAAIQHDYVVGIHSVETVPEFPLPYIVMEYVAGETLAARLAREPALTVKEAVVIVRQVAIGLAAAHDRGLVHRDIKPSNILLQWQRDTPSGMEGWDGARRPLTPAPLPFGRGEGEGATVRTNGRGEEEDATARTNRRGEGEEATARTNGKGVANEESGAPSLVAKITDFGLARAVEAADQESRQRLTRTGHMLGTPAYMSPEHILAPEKVGAQSDVYSLGVVLYELLTGQLPFAGTAHQVLLQVVQRDPVAPRLRNVHIPPALSDITLACLAKEPARRYLSARELAVELERWQAGEKVRVRPLGLTGKLARWCCRNAALAAASTATGLLGIGLILFGLLLARFHGAADLRLQEERDHTANIHQETQRLAAQLALSRGLEQCAQGRADQGLLWLARALELAPRDAGDLQWSIRVQLAAWSRTTARLHGVFSQQGNVQAVGFSLDGRLLRVHNNGHESWQWDIASGRRVIAPATHAQGVSAAAFSPDGRTVLVGVESGALWIFDAVTGERRHFRRCHAGEITALAVSADGNFYLTGGQDKTAQKWNARVPGSDPLGPRLEHPGTVEAVAFSPDGRMLLTGCDDHQARLWDADAGKPIGSPLIHEGAVTAVAFSPDGRLLLTASKDHTARLWDAATGRPIGSPLRHKDKVFAAVFSCDGRWIATGGNDCTVRVWEARSGVAVGAPLMHDGPVYAVAFSADGRWLATGGEDFVARLWQLPDAESLEHRVSPDGRTTVLAFSPDGHSIAVAVDFATLRSLVQRFDARSWELAGPPLRHDGFVHAVTFSPDGKLLLTGNIDRTARLWNTATGEPIDPSIQLNHQVYAVAFSPDGRVVITGDEDKRIGFWDSSTLAALRPPLIHQAAVCALAFSPDGRLILSGSWDKTAQLWDAESGAPRGSPLRHHGPVMAVAFSPDGKYFVTGSRDSTTQVWDTATGEARGPSLLHLQPVLTVAISPDGRMLATGSEDDTACLWDLATRYRVGPPLVHRNDVSAVAFRPDGRVLVTTGEESLVREWTVPAPVEGEPERILLWVQVATGMELEADGRVHQLPAETWFQRHERLEQLGGPLDPSMNGDVR